MVTAKEKELRITHVKENLKTIKNGAIVNLVANWEHELVCDKDYTVISDAYTIGDMWVVDLKGIGPFDLAMLKKVVTKYDKNSTTRHQARG